MHEIILSIDSELLDALSCKNELTAKIIINEKSINCLLKINNNKNYVNRNINSYINKLLANLGIPSNLKGYRYIRDILIYFYSTNDVNKVGEMYNYVSMKNKISTNRVEKNIRTAIDYVCTYGNYEYINEIFGYSISYKTVRPTNMQFLNSLLDIIKNDFY